MAKASGNRPPGDDIGGPDLPNRGKGTGRTGHKDFAGFDLDRGYRKLNTRDRDGELFFVSDPDFDRRGFLGSGFVFDDEEI